MDAFFGLFLGTMLLFALGILMYGVLKKSNPVTMVFVDEGSFQSAKCTQRKPAMPLLGDEATPVTAIMFSGGRVHVLNGKVNVPYPPDTKIRIFRSANGHYYVEKAD